MVDPSARKVLITRKGLPNYSGWTYSSFIIATNHRDAIAIPEKDRRFAVLSNGTTMSAAIRHSINDFLSDQSNVSSLAHYLAGYDTGDYDPYALPIATSAKTAMADFARSDLDRALDEALDPSTYDGRAHLSGEIFTIAQALRAVSSAAASQDLKLPEGGWHPIAKKELEKRLRPRRGARWSQLATNHQGSSDARLRTYEGGRRQLDERAESSRGGRGREKRVSMAAYSARLSVPNLSSS
ncbi:MAG: hypothetical protein WDN31_05260 [Hyphomicrobium sp.]